jgi:DNA-binding MarR family transcriptional regulator
MAGQKQEVKAPNPITNPQSHLAWIYLRNREVLTAGELAELMEISRMGAYLHLVRLEEMGLSRSSRHPRDEGGRLLRIWEPCVPDTSTGR